MGGRTRILTAVLVLTGCRGELASNAPEAETGARISHARAAAADTDVDTLMVDVSSSEIAWSGTKMWGRGGHTGTVGIEFGHLLMRDDLLVGGHVVVDMTTIGITDIPPDQPEPIALLTEHLEDPLFFHVERFPQASIRILGSNQADEHLLLADGLLTIRGVTRSIRFPIEVIQAGRDYRSRFRIDRFDWNVAYEGGFGASRFAARNFVDRDIELDIRLEVQK